MNARNIPTIFALTRTSMCALELVDLGWDSMTDYADPIRLVQAIDG